MLGLPEQEGYPSTRLSTWLEIKYDLKHLHTVKFRKLISPGAYIFQRPFFEGLIIGGAYIRRGLPTMGNLRFKIGWASLIVWSKFTVFFFLLCILGQCSKYKPPGAYIWRGDLTEGFVRYRIGRLIFGGAYTWRGLFSEFYGILYVGVRCVMWVWK